MKYILLIILISFSVLKTNAQLEDSSSSNAIVLDSNNSYKDDTNETSITTQSITAEIDSSKAILSTTDTLQKTEETEITKDSSIQDTSTANATSTNSTSNDSKNPIVAYIIIAFICGAILFNKKLRHSTFKIISYVVKSIISIIGFLILEGLQNKNSNQNKNRNLKVYWWQCKKCNAILQKSSAPSSFNCLVGGMHSWTKLGEIGSENYQCKYCGALVNANKTPSSFNCPSGKMHYWTKL